MGCEVIKVEQPKTGSQSRALWEHEGVGMCWQAWNRSKKSLAVDAKSPAGRDLLLELVPHVDIVLSGLRAGTMDKWGLGYEAISRFNPGIVYVSLSGWGEGGPYSTLGTNGAGFDGYAGLQPPDRRSDGLPQLPEMPGTRGEVHYGAVVGVMQAALAATAAYARRQRTGQGAYIEVAEGDAAVSMLFDRLFWKLNFGLDGGRPQPWPAASRTRYQYYPTADGKTIFFSPAQPKFWRRMCAELDRPDLLDSRVNTEAERLAVAEITKTKTRAEWVAWCIEHDIPCAPVNEDLQDLLDDPHFRARDLICEVENDVKGRVQLFATPVKAGDQEFAPRRAPARGEHTDELLERFGLEAARVNSLRTSGVLE
jgi:crotonobetainyl-CoA:carnitine CoA-transferase CaiB-like acyl-CoA transferase